MMDAERQEADAVIRSLPPIMCMLLTKDEYKEALDILTDALKKAREEAEADKARLMEALIDVETWWLEQGRNNFTYGAPHCIFTVREILDIQAPHDQRRITTGTEIKHKEYKDEGIKK
jgi:hypothetical protein